MKAIRASLFTLALVALVGLVGCACVAWSVWPHDCPEQERVQVGMTADEVRAVLGEPPSPHDGYWVCECPTAHNHPVEVHFGGDGRVKSVSRFEW